MDLMGHFNTLLCYGAVCEIEVVARGFAGQIWRSYNECFVHVVS